MNMKRRNFIVKQILKEEIKRYLKKQKELYEVRGLLPRNIKREKLHDILGIPADKLVNDYSVEDLFKRQKNAINSGKTSYQLMIQRLNWVAVLNKTRNPSVTKKFRQVMDKLHTTFRKK